MLTSLSVLGLVSVLMGVARGDDAKEASSGATSAVGERQTPPAASPVTAAAPATQPAPTPGTPIDRANRLEGDDALWTWCREENPNELLVCVDARQPSRIVRAYYPAARKASFEMLRNQAGDKVYFDVYDPLDRAASELGELLTQSDGVNPPARDADTLLLTVKSTLERRNEEMEAAMRLWGKALVAWTAETDAPAPKIPERNLTHMLKNLCLTPDGAHDSDEQAELTQLRSLHTCLRLAADTAWLVSLDLWTVQPPTDEPEGVFNRMADCLNKEKQAHCLRRKDGYYWDDRIRVVVLFRHEVDLRHPEVTLFEGTQRIEPAIKPQADPTTISLAGVPYALDEYTFRPVEPETLTLRVSATSDNGTETRDFLQYIGRPAFNKRADHRSFWLDEYRTFLPTLVRSPNHKERFWDIADLGGETTLRLSADQLAVATEVIRLDWAVQASVVAFAAATTDEDSKPSLAFQTFDFDAAPGEVMKQVALGSGAALRLPLFAHEWSGDAYGRLVERRWALSAGYRMPVDIGHPDDPVPFHDLFFNYRMVFASNDGLGALYADTRAGVLYAKDNLYKALMSDSGFQGSRWQPYGTATIALKIQNGARFGAAFYALPVLQGRQAWDYTITPVFELGYGG